MKKLETLVIEKITEHLEKNNVDTSRLEALTHLLEVIKRY